MFKCNTFHAVQLRSHQRDCVRRPSREACLSMTRSFSRMLTTPERTHKPLDLLGGIPAPAGPFVASRRPKGRSWKPFVASGCCCPAKRPRRVGRVGRRHASKRLWEADRYSGCFGANFFSYCKAEIHSKMHSARPPAEASPSSGSENARNAFASVCLRHLGTIPIQSGHSSADHERFVNPMYTAT